MGHRPLVRRLVASFHKLQRKEAFSMPVLNVLKGQSPLRWFGGLALAIACLIIVAVPAVSVGNFYDHLDALSYHVRNRDVAAAKAELGAVTEFYDRSRQWGMQWFVDSYLFGDSFIHQVAFSYFTADYETIVADLEDKVADHRASYFLGIAKFRLAQLRYRAIEGEGAAVSRAKGEIINEVLEKINPDFERALRSDPGERFDYKWNYDLTSDPETIRRALEQPKPVEPPEMSPVQGEGTPVRRRRG